MGRLKDVLKRRSASTFVGRGAELDSLLEVLADDGPLVVCVHGLAGIGKSRLAEAFGEEARSRGATVVRLDCREIEPTECGLLREMGAALGGECVSAEAVAVRLSAIAGRVVLVLDTYEVLRLLDTWLRQVLVPALPDNARVVLFGRDAPAAAWLTAPGWLGLFRTIRLESLVERDAEEVLQQTGMPAEEARRLNRFAHGHPLALTLVASILARGDGVDFDPAAGHRILDRLSRLYVSEIQDARTRQTVEAASVVRRITGSVLHAMLPEVPPQDALERLRPLPFVELGMAGLQMHDAVREATAAHLRAADPQRFRAYRRAAYRQLTAELRSTPANDLWHYTADLLYLLENPVVREAFFPTGASDYTVEPARAEDRGAVESIVTEHEGAVGRRRLLQVWNLAPQTFRVARDRKGAISGFYCAFDPKAIAASAYKDDPVVRVWLNHLDESPMPRTQQALFLRRWLSREEGEGLSPVQGACWLDVKRKYLEMRPGLRRVYLALRNLTPYAAAATQLGFRVLEDAAGSGEEVYRSAVLDFGPASVDGWFTRLVAAELGMDDGGLLDISARELVIDGRREGLTRLEFGVMEYLAAHEGAVVSRAALLENVWSQSFDGGSNVVDAVVRGLRKKLAERAGVIEAVQGVGYRYRGQGV
jgi:hypothetical protein